MYIIGEHGNSFKGGKSLKTKIMRGYLTHEKKKKKIAPTARRKFSCMAENSFYSHSTGFGAPKIFLA